MMANFVDLLPSPSLLYKNGYAEYDYEKVNRVRICTSISIEEDGSYVEYLTDIGSDEPIILRTVQDLIDFRTATFLNKIVLIEHRGGGTTDIEGWAISTSPSASRCIFSSTPTKPYFFEVGIGAVKVKVDEESVIADYEANWKGRY